MFIFLLALFSASSLAQADFEVDLHNHVFFHEGVGVSWLGGFHRPIQATSWQDRYRSRINENALLDSKVKVIIVALYGHPFFWGGTKGSIRRQIDSVREFIASHPDWIVAQSPSELKEALSKGKRALILSIEGASGVIEDESDLKEFIDSDGVRVVTLHHFTDDEYGGSAFLRGFRAVANPMAWLRSLFSSQGEVRLNSLGLTQKGKDLIQAMILRGVWIDFSHSSDASAHEMISVLNGKQPILFTHTTLRRYLGAERGIADWELNEVQKSGGIVGILPSEEMLVGTEVPKESCSCASCVGGVASLKTHFSELSKFSVMTSFGTDINAPLPFIRGDCNPDKADPGYWQYRQVQSLWRAVGQRGLTAERFAEIWEKVRH